MATQTLNGSCHCGAIAYTVEVDPETAITCNCSICSRARRGLGLRAQGEVQADVRGEGKLGDYQFNKKRAAPPLLHRAAASRAMPRARAPDGSAMVGINLRCCRRRRCRQALAQAARRPQPLAAVTERKAS